MTTRIGPICGAESPDGLHKCTRDQYHSGGCATAYGTTWPAGWDALNPAVRRHMAFNLYQGETGLTPRAARQRWDAATPEFREEWVQRAARQSRAFDRMGTEEQAAHNARSLALTLLHNDVRALDSETRGEG